jgi:hypothetical protein
MHKRTKSSDNFKSKRTNYLWRGKGMLKRPSGIRHTKEGKGRVDADMGIMGGE